MREIREKPIRAAHIKEKVTFAPKELLRKGLDNGTERLRTQLRDAAQQGQRDEYGGDTVEDTAAGAVRRVEKALRKCGEHTERRAAPVGKNVPESQSGTASYHAGQNRGTSGIGAGPYRSSQQNRAERGFARQVSGPKTGKARTGKWPTARSGEQGRKMFIRERGRKTAQRRLRDRRDILRYRNSGAQTGDTLYGEYDSHPAGRIKERNRALGPSIRENARGIDRVQGREGSPASGRPALAAERAHRAAREAVINASRYQQAETAVRSVAPKAAQATGRVLRDIRAAARSLTTALAAGDSAALTLLLVVCLIGLLLASPFGIFFSGQDSGTGYTMPEAVAALNEKFSARIQTIQAENFYDELDMDNAGSPSTGTVRPFGLDCSGFVDWVFYNQSGGSYVIGRGGGASAQHGACTPISWADAQPGDLVFYPDDVHVGIVCGFDADGGILIIHCASDYDNVVVTGRSGFASAARPNYFAD